jgi:hypothetical protein
MKSFDFYQNTELATKLGVSNVSIGRYIKSAQKGQLALELVMHSGKNRIARTDNNLKILYEILGIESRFKNKIGFKEYLVDQKIYQKLDQAQLLELINNLKNKHIIKPKFAYLLEEDCSLETDSIYLDKRSMIEDQVSSIFVNNITNLVEHYFQTKRKINVIDFTSYNVNVSTGIVSKLESSSLLNYYITVNIDQKRTVAIKNYFANKQISDKFISLVVDFERPYTANTLFETIYFPTKSFEKEKVTNIFLVSGIQLFNQNYNRKLLEYINSIANHKDLVLFDFKVQKPSLVNLSLNKTSNKQFKILTNVFDYLGIPEVAYSIIEEQSTVSFDITYYAYFESGLQIVFDQLYQGAKIAVDIPEGSKIKIFEKNYFKIQSVFTEFETVKFEPLIVNSSIDQNYMSMVFKKNLKRSDIT